MDTSCITTARLEGCAAYDGLRHHKQAEQKTKSHKTLQDSLTPKKQKTSHGCCDLLLFPGPPLDLRRPFDLMVPPSLSHSGIARAIRRQLICPWQVGFPDSAVLLGVVLSQFRAPRPQFAARFEQHLLRSSWTNNGECGCSFCGMKGLPPHLACISSRSSRSGFLLLSFAAPLFLKDRRARAAFVEQEAWLLV